MPNSPALFLIAASVLAQASLAAGPNLARSRPCKVSSVEGALTCDKALDGPKSQASRWGSNYGTDKNKDSAWFWVDLGTVQSVDSVAIYWEHSGSKPFAVQAWKGAGEVPTDNESDWETVFRDSTLVYQNPPVDMCLSFHRIKPTSTRFVRIRCYKRMFQFGFSIMELEIYGNGTTALERGAGSTEKGYPVSQGGSGNPGAILSTSTSRMIFQDRGHAFGADGRLAPLPASRPAGAAPQ